MLRRLLRLFDPRIGIAILVVVVTILVFQFVVGGIASERLGEAERSYRAAKAAVNTLEESVTLLKDSGATNAEQLKGRLSQIGAILPKTLDDVYVTTIFVNIADSSAIKLSKFEPQRTGSSAGGSSTSKILVVTGLEGSEYSFSATGKLSALIKFIQGIFSSDKVFATISNASLAVPDGLDADPDASISGIIVIWTDATVELESETEDVGEDASSTTIPGDTASSTSVPSGAEGAATTLPVSPEDTTATLPPVEASPPTAPPVTASPVTAPPAISPAPTTTIP